MDTEKPHLYFAQPAQANQQKIPLALGIGALAIGYCIGSRQWDWLGKGTARVANSLANLLSASAIHAFQRKNPQLYSELSHINH